MISDVIKYFKQLQVCYSIVPLLWVLIFKCVFLITLCKYNIIDHNRSRN